MTAEDVQAQLRQLAERGVGFDMNPTMMFTTAESMYSQWLDYFTRLDREWRVRVSAALDALSTPPADDVREALTRPLTGGERLTPDEAMQHAYAVAVTRAPGRMTWGEALREFATWVREHDARLIAEVRPDGTVTGDKSLRSRIEQMVANQQSWIDAGRSGQVISRDAVRDTLQKALDETVRPHGTVTDAEVEAAAGAICRAAEGESLSDVRMDMRTQYMREARDALEAAREVHP